MPFFIVDARARTGAAPGDIRDEDIRGATRDGSRETRGASPVDSRAREGEFGGPRAARTAPFSWKDRESLSEEAAKASRTILRVSSRRRHDMPRVLAVLGIPPAACRAPETAPFSEAPTVGRCAHRPARRGRPVSPRALVAPRVVGPSDDARGILRARARRVSPLARPPPPPRDAQGWRAGLTSPFGPPAGIPARKRRAASSSAPAPGAGRGPHRSRTRDASRRGTPSPRAPRRRARARADARGNPRPSASPPLRRAKAKTTTATAEVFVNETSAAPTDADAETEETNDPSPSETNDPSPSAAPKRRKEQPPKRSKRSAAQAAGPSGPSASDPSSSSTPAIDLIVTDVDGTLLGSDQTLSASTEAASRARAAALGVPCVVATGKSRGPWARELLPRLGADAPGVFVQGLVTCEADGTVLESVALDAEIAERVIRFADARGVTTVAFCGKPSCATAGTRTRTASWRTASRRPRRPPAPGVCAKPSPAAASASTNCCSSPRRRRRRRRRCSRGATTTKTRRTAASRCRRFGRRPSGRSRRRSARSRPRCPGCWSFYPRGRRRAPRWRGFSSTSRWTPRACSRSATARTTRRCSSCAASPSP